MAGVPGGSSVPRRGLASSTSVVVPTALGRRGGIRQQSPNDGLHDHGPTIEAKAAQRCAHGCGLGNAMSKVGSAPALNDRLTAKLSD